MKKPLLLKNYLMTLGVKESFFEKTPMGYEHLSPYRKPPMRNRAIIEFYKERSRQILYACYKLPSS